MKKVLIIGAKGMLGQELVRIFSSSASGEKKYEVFGWDFSEIDITDRNQVEKKIGVLRPEIIINAAAYNNVDKCEEPAEFAKAKKINGWAPGYLAEIAKNLRIAPSQSPPSKGGEENAGAIFIHYSTDYVFNGQKINGYKENDLPSPISNYGRSKLMGEKKAQKVGGRFYLIRLQRLFNRFNRPAFAPLRGASSGKESFFETMLNLAKTKSELEAVDEELANFTYAPDLARRTKEIIEQNLPFGIYHVTNEGRPVTWFGAAKILFEIIRNSHPELVSGSGSRNKFGMTNYKDIKLTPVPASKFPRPAKRPKFSILLNTKLAPLRPWTEALKEFLKEF